MAVETGQPHGGIRTGKVDWLAGLIGGLLATVPFVLLQFALGAEGGIAMAIPAMYGIEGPALGVGTGIHLFHGAVLGALYAGLVSVSPLRTYAAEIGGGVGLGVAYGVLTTVVFAAVVMPVWLYVVGFQATLHVPDFSVPSLVLHIIYGVALGVLYPLLNRLT